MTNPFWRDIGRGLRIWGLGFGVWGFRVWGLGFRVWGLGLRVSGLGFRVESLWVFGFRVQGEFGGLGVFRFFLGGKGQVRLDVRLEDYQALRGLLRVWKGLGCRQLPGGKPQTLNPKP